jgi:hypothetical protein
LETTVGFATPLKLRTALEAQFSQGATRVKGREPAMADEELMEPSIGTGYVPTFTVKLTELERA